MTTRERISEYATLQALGFSPRFVFQLIISESMLIAMIGGVTACLLTFPVANAFAKAVGTLFPVFEISGLTMALQLLCAAAVGFIAAVFPAIRVVRIRLVDGLRHVV